MRHVLGEVNGHVAERRAALAEVADFAANQESKMSRSVSPQRQHDVRPLGLNITRDMSKPQAEL